MKLNRSFFLAASFTTSCLAVGAPYWLIPYSKLNLPDALLGPGLVIVTLSALLLSAFRAASIRTTVFWLGLSVCAVVIGRVIVETVQDPTSHNLWPFEVIIASIVGLTCAATGAIAGKLIGKSLPKIPQGEG